MTFINSTQFNDSRLEKIIFVNRIRMVKIVMILAFFVLAGRILYLQIIAHEWFASRSENNRIHLQAIAPQRGIIKDYYGRVLATNKTVQSVFFSPAIAREAEVDNEKIISMISSILRFRQFSQRELLQRFTLKGNNNQHFLIKSDIGEKELARLMVRRHQLPGLVIETSSSRDYPYGEAFTHAVGYLGLIATEDLKDDTFKNQNYAGTQQIGKTGIERHYEDLLHGKVGWQKVEIDVKGRIHRVLSQQQPIHGSELLLGLDAQMQNLAWSLMKGRRGSVVAIEPSSGRLIVLLSSPAFNPNLMVKGVDTATYKKLSSSKTRPFFNRFARGHYPPASTIKPFYAIMALESNVVTPEYTIFDPGYFQTENDNRRYRNWLRRGHGKVNLERAIRVSNDTYFFSLAERMGYDLLSYALTKFGFGRRVAMDVYGESAGYIPSPEWKYARFNMPWFAGDNLNMGIGQGYLLTTPLQLAAATSVLANRGRWVRPRLLFGIDNKWINSWTNSDPIADVSADSANWQMIINGMVSVTSNSEGTAYRAALKLPYKMAGKTGTAQVVELLRDDDEGTQEFNEYTKDHSLFIGFAPVDNPKIAVVAIIENGGSGSTEAAPLAVEIVDNYLANKRLELSDLERSISGEQ